MWQKIFLGSKACKKEKISIKKFDEKKIPQKLVRKKIRRIQSYNGVDSNGFTFYYLTTPNLHYRKSNLINLENLRYK